MKFGIHHNTYSYDGRGAKIFESLKQLVGDAEASEFDSLWLSDHLHQYRFVGRPEEPMLDSWTTLPALAALTSKIKLGAMVTANTTRHPSVLAKMGATLDVLSNGRLFMGIGAANFQEEAEAYGIPFPPTPERLRRLEESVQIMKLMWTDDLASFDGKYYKIKNAYCNPKPVQKPHPPILIGGNGEKKTLKIVAKYADACNLLFVPPQTVERLLGALREYCRSVARDYDSILKTRTGRVAIGTDGAAIEAAVTAAVSDKARRDGIIYGNPEKVKQKIEDYGNAGLEYMIVSFDPTCEREMMKLFADDVMKSF